MLSLLFAILYVNAGFQLGKKATKTWKKGDSDSLESFLLFPVSHVRGKVGDPTMPLMGGINSGDTLFRVLVTLGWPVMVAWNALLVLGLLGPDKMIRRLSGEQKADRYKALEASLLKEEQRVDKVIRKLEAPKRPRKPRKTKSLPPGAPTPDSSFAPPASNGVVESPPPAGLFVQPPPAQAEPASPPVQVRVTVDVTASGPSPDETDRAEPDSSRTEEAPAPKREHIVH